MSNQQIHTIVSWASLTDANVGAISELRALCNTYESLDLKVRVEHEEAHPSQQTNYFLAYADEMLVGYCALDRGSPIELCGMVHPGYRRQGIGRALLEAAVEECKRAGANRLGIICEEASLSGKTFVAIIGAEYRFAEYHMELAAHQKRTGQDERLQLQRIGLQDAEAFIQMQAKVFGDPEDVVRQIVLPDIIDPQSSFYLARLAGTPVGCLKLFLHNNQAGIYGFGVLPEYRKYGFGRQMLTGIIEMALAEQPERIYLEVETDNQAAIGLYQSSGFTITTTYGYYRLAF